ncbi:MAG: protein kinase [Deltaproteobacteria bacterium]|nr:protein kinase [Deltaproteobacteria bacterium]
MTRIEHATTPALSEGAALPLAPEATTTEARFEVRGELGAGGMGRVVIVHDRRLGRDVALKEPATEADARRLEREARVTARLEHPGIVPIYDSGRHADGRPWFAMRLVRGASLADRIEDLAREADPARARAGLLRHVRAAAEAVAYAHARGVVHRDLKTANIMIGQFGETQVIDWGLALAPDLPPADGAHAGTPGAMSPEQAAGGRVDARSDVWCLGRVLDVTLGAGGAGERPRELAAIVARAMAADPAARYPDAGAFADDLGAWLDGRRVHAHSYTPLELLGRLARAWRVPLVIVGVAIAALATVLVIMFARVRSERDQAEANLAVSLTSEARRALRDDARGEAEVLAAHALASAPVAEARGILAAAGGPRPAHEVLSTTPLEGCEPIDVAGGRVLCTGPERVQVHDLTGRVLWSRGAPNAGAALLGSERVVVYDGRALSWRDAATGAVIGDARATPCAGRLVPTGPGTASALVWTGACLARVDHEGVTALPLDACRGAAGAVGGDVLVACADGALVTIDGGVATRHEVGLPIAPRGPLPSALARAGPGRVVVGDAAGGLVVIDLARPRDHRRRVVHDGMIQRVVVREDGALVVALGERTAPIVFDLARGASLGRLPDRAWPRRTRAVGFLDDGALVSAGRALERWDFAAVVPRALDFGLGIGGLALTRDGGTLAVGHDNGVSLVDVATRRVVRHEAWQSNTVKTFAFGSDDALFAHGIASDAIMRFDRDGGSRDVAGPVPGRLRRLAALADGSLVLAPYGPRVTRRDASGRFEQMLDATLIDLAASADGRALVALDEDRHIFCGLALTPCGRDPRARAVAIADPERVAVARPGELATFEIVGGTARERERFAAAGTDFLEVAIASRDAGGRWVAGAARDGSLWLFSEGSADPVAVLRDHVGRTDTITIDPRGRFVVAGGWDGHVVFWPVPGPDVDRRGEVEAAWGLALGDVFAPTSAR